jgi:prepilin signal peptidase PulO-like enzyme (type II secretory pathway)
MILTATVCAVFFACVALVGAELSRLYCARIEPFADGPRPGRAPVVVLALAAAVIGGLLAFWKVPPLQIALAAIVVFALVACWCSDAQCGIVPDIFTLGPLAVLLLFALSQRNWEVWLSAAIPFAFFAGAALFTRGKGMGWGDAKLVALTGAALGAPLALVALPIACIAAVIAQRFVKGTGTPMAFAPYIAALTGIALPLGIIR